MVSTKSPRTLKWSKRKLVLFSLITMMIVVLFLELIFRVVFYFRFKDLHNTVTIQGSPLRISDSLLIYKNQPFYVDYKMVYQNNEEGMRSAVGDEFIGTKGQKEFWVLLTGGSAMEGMGSNKDGEWLDITGIKDHPYEQTIGYYLQQYLQTRMPDKNVKVFNGATSGYTIYQSYCRYMSLSQKMQPDWVISMDGVNDPAALKPGETTRSNSEKEWATYPQFHFPLKLIIPMTQNSALLNSIKNKLFHIKEDFRMLKNKHNNFPARHKWAAESSKPIQMSAFTPDIERGLGSFLEWLIRYDSVLGARNQKHLLLLQPHMSMRDTFELTYPERAVSNYFRLNYSDTAKNRFMQSLYNRYTDDTSRSNIITMNGVHYWKDWVFVDYCHFTNRASQRIAKEIGNYIISNGKTRPFLAPGL